MESIVYNCNLSECGMFDLGPCSNVCGSHLVLCSEQLGDQCCYLVTAEYAGGVPGRPLRDDGVPQLPRLMIADSDAGDLDHRRAAATYREAARYERASVDAFLHAAALLEQVGAPFDLIERHRDAAREEGDHARLALAAAQALDGRTATLGELSITGPEHDLESFVRDLIHDGCIGELIAAREAGWALEQDCVREREELREYWELVASQEAGHAQLAWQTIEWLLSTRPALGSLITSELGVAMRGRAPVMGSHEDELGLPAASTTAVLREQAIAELVADARALVGYHPYPPPA
jgi:hypothetical protein